ncbi:MAG: hypothetical protein KAS32_00060 [Candidatus Peribacteraceae bacterium]|nr:hypothetical protein [Candidatus Peribacteraceae bacterium]
MSLRQKIQQVKRDSTDLLVTFKDDEGNLVDITGSTVILTVKEKQTDEDIDAIFQITQDTHSDPTNGETVLSVTTADTEDVDPKIYFFDIQIKFLDGKIQTPSLGTWEILQDITYAT